jgi:hypothetical protein
MSAYATRLFTTAATVVVAALSLTACQDGQGVRDGNSAAAPSSRPAKTQGADPNAGAQGSSSPAESSGSSNDSSAATGTTGTSGSNAAAKGVPCTGANTEVTAEPVPRPLNHLLITATNTGSKTCALYGFPAVRFDDAQSVPSAFAETKQQAITTLEPGESGYAGVRLSAAGGSGSRGFTAKTFEVSFFDARNNGIGPAAHPGLPAQGVHVDDALRVTYWVPDAEDALQH